MIERANLRHERERIRTIGWVGVVLGVFSWICGGMCLPLFSRIRDPYRDSHIAVIAVGFGFMAAIGCVFATRARSVSKEAMPHAVLALILNFGYLLLALALVWR